MYPSYLSACKCSQSKRVGIQADSLFPGDIKLPVCRGLHRYQKDKIEYVDIKF